MTKSLHEQAVEAAWEYYSKQPNPGMINVIEIYLTFLAEHGWKLVPRTPSDKMFEETRDHCTEVKPDLPLGRADDIWQAIFDAAPSPEDVGMVGFTIECSTCPATHGMIAGEPGKLSFKGMDNWCTIIRHSGTEQG